MALKGLVIRQPWIGMILRGEKTWEMRSQPCHHRGSIALIEKGTGTVVAIARMVDDLPALSEIEMRATIGQHGIPEAQIADAVQKGWTRPWVLSEVVRLPAPVPYNHTSGGSWVNLTSAEEAAVLAARGHRDAPQERSYRDEVEDRYAPFLASNHQWDADWPADNDKPQPATGKSNASIRVADSAALEITWDDDNTPHRAQRRLEPLGLLAVLTVLVCQVGFVVHVVLGLFTETFSFFSAFKWLVPMFVAILVAMATGQGHLLAEEK